MSLRHAIERVAVADARRFEARMLKLQRRILERCDDPATRRVLEELVAEEEEHVRRLNGIAAVEMCEERDDPPELSGKSVAEMLKETAAMEKAAVGFYTMLAERARLPAAREVFQKIAEAERGHEARLAALLREIGGRTDEADGTGNCR